MHRNHADVTPRHAFMILKPSQEGEIVSMPARRAPFAGDVSL